MSKRPLLVIAAVLSLALLSLYSLDATIVILSLAVSYAVIQNYLGAKIFDSKLFRFIVACLTYLVFLQLVILLVWVFNHNFPLDQCIRLTGLLMIPIYLTERRWGKGFNRTEKTVRWFNLSDGLSLLVGLVILGAIFVAPLKQSWSKYQRIDVPAVSSQYVNTSLDDSSQLSRFNDRFQLNRGVLYDTDRTDQVIHQNTISTYPPSWISANSAIIKAFFPSINVGGQSLVAYIISKSFWLLVLMYLFCKVVFVLYRLFTKHDKKLAPADYVWLTGALGYFSYYTILEQFKEGFYAFIPLLISQLLIMAFLLQLGNDKEGDGKLRSLFPLVLLFTNAVLAWILLLPAIAVATLAIILRRDSVKNLWQSVWQPLKAQALVIGLAIVAVLVQLRVITADTSRTFREGVNDPGAITFHSRWYFVFIFIGVGLLFGLAVRKAKLLRAISPYLFGLLATALFIYLFQILTIEKPEYYFYKTLNTFLVLALPLAIVGWLCLIRLVNREAEVLTALCVSAGLVLCLPLIIGVDPTNTSNLSYLKGSRGMSLEDSTFIYNDMDKRAKVAFAERTVDTLFYVPDDVGHNIIASNIVRSIQKVDGCDSKIFYDMLTSDDDGFYANIKDCQTDPLVLVTKPETLEQVKADLRRYEIGSNVTVISVR